MIKNLVHDPMFLGIKSQPSDKNDINTAKDLVDTLIEHRESCVGMAANMIGISKRIIAVNDMGKILVMYNPIITKKTQPFDTKEGCLSLLGEPRKTIRYKNITVQYQDENFRQTTRVFQGFTAQIIQHEVDHCNGILI